MKKIILTILLLTSCANYQANNNDKTNNFDLNYYDNLSFEEFKIRLEQYSDNSSYPNINN